MTKYSNASPDSFLAKSLEFVRKRIKEEVKSQGYTYESFASLFKKTEAWFSHMVNGHRRISIDTLLEIAEKLNINPASLLPGGNPGELPTLEEYMWNILKERLDKYFDEKFEQKLKDKK